MIEAVVFDLDGTILDTLEDLADGVNHALGTFNLPALEYSEFKQLIGSGSLHLCENAMKISQKKKTSSANGLSKDYIDCSDITPEMILMTFRNYYEKNINKKTKPYRGIEKELEKLQNDGIQLAVLSNKPDKFTKDLIDRYFANIEFQYVVGSSEAFPHKPDPASLKYIIRKMGVNPEKTVFLGDSEIDMQTAVAANVVPAGVLWGFRTKGVLIESGARILIENPGEIFHQLKEWAIK